ncbi:hypothetical protein Bca52824_076774 [Brassica carinata]|uniref:Uncharacterized protein n=1 Tax=Brassica carinata TaxID=52824 RepID=A0A8X7PTQ0_BRACI|nr:hypothetical protein Bca52824_076774 [Brassica carinata]
MLALMLHEASFPANARVNQRLPSYRHILEESNVYELNGFDVAKSNLTYKFDETPVSIRH